MTQYSTYPVDQKVKILRSDNVVKNNQFNDGHLNIIFNSIHEGILAIDQVGRVIIFNRAAEKLMDIRAEIVLGQKVEEVIPNTRLHSVLRTGQAELDQEQCIGDITIITNRMPIRDENCRVIGAVAVFRDITEVIRLAEEVTNLQETKTLLHAIINSTQDAISVVNEKGLGILFNPAYTRLTGLTEEEVLNKSATVDISEGESMHMQVLRTRQPVKGVPMKVGPKRKEVVVDVAPIIVNGALRGSVGVIHDVSEIRRLSEELGRAQRHIRHLEAKYTFEDIIGVSEGIRGAIEKAKRAASTPVTVLLRGESGTGKELFAHAIHQASNRSRGQFIRVNCAAIPDTLLESELFGYAEGAFTGARRGGYRGYFTEADGGTIFLDEIGELNPATQVKLLRVLQEREIFRVGDCRPISVNVRIIAATNSNLEKLVRKGNFREDLYYRLSVVPIHIPPLRERREDIPLLVDFLLKKLNADYGRNVSSLSEPALHYLMNYDWSGNIRELENILGSAIINMKQSETIVKPEHLPSLILNSRVISMGMVQEPSLLTYAGESLAQLRERYERELLVNALSYSGGNRTHAARMLKISLRSLYNKMEKYALV